MARAMSKKMRKKPVAAGGDVYVRMKLNSTCGKAAEPVPTVVKNGRSLLTVPPAYHHERVLLLSASNALDAIDAKRRIFGIFDVVAEHAEGELARARAASGTSWAAILDEELAEGDKLREVVVGQVTEAALKVKSRVDMFFQDYLKAAHELGNAEVLEILGRAHEVYARPPAPHLSLWKELLGFLEAAGLATLASLRGCSEPPSSKSFDVFDYLREAKKVDELFNTGSKKTTEEVSK